jgi:uncharacterized BrkB/YihY/UPF0761 family membrane protein
MGEIVGLQSRTTGQSWTLRTLYAVLILSALALVTLFVGDILAAFEDAEEHEEHDHFFLFDLAWPVFVVSFLATIVAAVVAYVVGRARRSARLRTFGARAAAYCVVAIAAVVLAEAAGL